jgi:hypothetical protein
MLQYDCGMIPLKLFRVIWSVSGLKHHWWVNHHGYIQSQKSTNDLPSFVRYPISDGKEPVIVVSSYVYRTNIVSALYLPWHWVLNTTEVAAYQDHNAKLRE